MLRHLYLWQGIQTVSYTHLIRPQKKEQKKKELMLKEVATGDTVLTTSGFYGTVIDIEDDTVIVESVSYTHLPASWPSLST